MTKTSSLKSLSLSAFRGASDPFILNFEAGKKLTLIFGENGSGKTTICDAFEFLAREKIGSLEERGLGAGLEKYYHSSSKKAEDLVVKLDDGAATCEGVIAGKKVAVRPTGAQPDVTILRQRQISALVETKPADRYEAIKRFIDITEFELSEKALSDLFKDLKAQEKSAKSAEAQSLDSLHGFFEAAGKPAGLNPVSWAKIKLESTSANREEGIKSIGLLRAACSKLEELPQAYAVYKNALQDARNTLDAANSAFEHAAQHVGAAADAILALLEAGRKYLSVDADPVECPLCGSTEKAKELSTSIETRLEQMAALRDATAKKHTAESAFARKAAELEQLEARRVAAVSAFRDVVARFDWKEGLSAPKAPVPDDVEQLVKWLAENDELKEAWRKKESEWLDDRKFVSALRSAVEQYESNLQRTQDLKKLSPRVEKALKLCIDERQKFTDGVLKNIAEEVGKLYEVVHPGEGMDKIALPLDPSKRASLELKAQYSGKDVPPQAYFSQSHLDTLGLCVFLALALRDSPDAKILVLDDVLGSVDEPHVDRVIQLVYDTAKKFRHAVVTTHYRPWKEKYRWGALRPDQPFQFVELKNGTSSSGISTGDIMPEIAHLKAYLAASPVDHQTICAKAGVILEMILDYLVQKYECRVPRKKDNRFTLGELLPAVDKKLRGALEIVEIDASGNEMSRRPLGQIFSDIENIVQVRNATGAHFNEIAQHLPEHDVVSFARHVESLFDALVHPDHGWPNNDKTGIYWKNQGDSRRLFPLKRPS